MTTPQANTLLSTQTASSEADKAGSEWGDPVSPGVPLAVPRKGRALPQRGAPPAPAGGCEPRARRRAAARPLPKEPQRPSRAARRRYRAGTQPLPIGTPPRPAPCLFLPPRPPAPCSQRRHSPQLTPAAPGPIKAAGGRRRGPRGPGEAVGGLRGRAGLGRRRRPGVPLAEGRRRAAFPAASVCLCIAHSSGMGFWGRLGTAGSSRGCVHPAVPKGEAAAAGASSPRCSLLLLSSKRNPAPSLVLQVLCASTRCSSPRLFGSNST